MEHGIRLVEPGAGCQSSELSKPKSNVVSRRNRVSVTTGVAFKGFWFWTAKDTQVELQALLPWYLDQPFEGFAGPLTLGC